MGEGWGEGDHPRAPVVDYSPCHGGNTTAGPQHSTEPSPFTPQVWSLLALTDANSLAGGVASPAPSDPQHSTEPSRLTPHVWLPPALTEANLVSAGPPFPAPPRRGWA